MSRELLARAWAAGGGPGDAPLTIDLDSTVCETYGLGKEGARRHGYTGQRGYHPLLAVAADTGDVLMVRLRQGRANTARGADHFLRETVGRVRYAGAIGQLTVRADSGFYTHAMVAVCRKMDVRYSITVRQHQSLRNLIEAIPEKDWTAIPYWMDGGADVAETEYTPFQHEPDAAPARLIVRRVKPAPGSQLALLTDYSYHACITDREGDTLELEADHRRHAEIENAIRDLKYGVGLNHLPSGRFPANAAWLAVQVMAHNLARWTARIGLGELVVTTQDPAATLLLPGRTHHPQGPSPHPASAPTLALGKPVQSRPGAIASPAAPFLTPPSASDPSTRPSNRLVVPRQAELRGSPAAICPTISPSATACEPSTSPWRSCHRPAPAQIQRGQALQPIIHASHPLRHQPPRIPSVDLGFSTPPHSSFRWIGAKTRSPWAIRVHRWIRAKLVYNSQKLNCILMRLRISPTSDIGNPQSTEKMNVPAC